MCYSRCPYEDREGECKINGPDYPSDAHCVESICPECDRETELPGYCKNCSN